MPYVVCSIQEVVNRIQGSLSHNKFVVKKLDPQNSKILSDPGQNEKEDLNKNGNQERKGETFLFAARACRDPARKMRLAKERPPHGFSSKSELSGLVLRRFSDSISLLAVLLHVRVLKSGRWIGPGFAYVAPGNKKFPGSRQLKSMSYKPPNAYSIQCMAQRS